MRLRLAFLLICLAAFSTQSFAQNEHRKTDSTDNSEELLEMLGNDGSNASKAHDNYVSATFKSTRVINGHSVETDGKGVLDFRIAHRFGAVNQGTRNFFGLDNAYTKIGFDYGITDWLTVGLGRGTFEKEYDGYLKAKLYRQTIDNRHPVTITGVLATSAQSMDAPAQTAGKDYPFSNRLCYATQLLIARKFTKRFSVQLMPTYVHYNIVPNSDISNDLIAMGIGGRLKVSNRIAITGEYYYRIPNGLMPGTHNSLSLGLDIETGGHVFQLFFTNSSAITERAFIGQTADDWGDGNIHFGFNISRVFTVVRPKEFKGSANKIW